MKETKECDRVLRMIWKGDSRMIVVHVHGVAHPDYNRWDDSERHFFIKIKSSEYLLHQNVLRDDIGNRQKFGLN